MNTPLKASELPLWFRFLPVLLLAASGAAGGVAWVRPPRTYFGLTHETFLALVLIAALLTGSAAVLFLFFPHRLIARGLYYGWVKGRGVIAWLVLYGLLEAYLRLPLLYVEKPNLVLNHAALLGWRGLALTGLAAVLFIALWKARPIENPFPPGWQAWMQTKRAALHSTLSAIETRWSALLPALAPIALILFVIYGLWGAKLSDYLPVFWNDATGYWLWIRQFSFYGLGGGYNYPNELMPAAAFNRYGEGSPLYIYVYGLFGQLLGWAPHLPILVNFGLIATSVYSFSRLARLETHQNLMLALLLSVSWPVMIFAATTSHEPLNLAVGIVFAWAFLRLRQSERIAPVPALLLMLFAFLAGMLRLSWVILFPPLFYFVFRGSPLRRIALSLLMSVLLAFLILRITDWLVPPVNNSILAALENERGALFGMFLQLMAQVKKLVIKQTTTPAWATLFLLLMLWTAAARELLALWRQKTRLAEIFKSQAAFDVYNVLTLLAAGLTLYLVNGFYRVFYIPLLVSLLLHIAQKKYQVVWRVTLFSLLFAPVMLNGQGDWQGARLNYTYRAPEFVTWQSGLRAAVTYDSAAVNPWCNTVLITLRSYDARLAALPPGIGISYLQDPFPSTPVRSRYLWINDVDRSKLEERIELRLEKLAELPEGTLYRNLDANCSP